MAQKRKKSRKQVGLFKKNSTWMLEKVIESQVNRNIEMDQEETKASNNKEFDEESASLNWLVNLSAASLFPSANQEESKSYNVEHHPYETSVNTKPGLTYTELIEKALQENGELTVSEIYKWIYSKYPYYKQNDGRWKNSIRHNLSINPQFRKGDKCNNGGHYWTLNKEYDDQFKKWELRKGTKEDRRKRTINYVDEDETERATRSILPPLESRCVEFSEDYDTSSARSYADDFGSVGSSDPSLVRVATEILSGIDRQVEVEYMDKTNAGISAPLIIEEDIFENSDPILTDPLLFSDCLELGFQPYELIDSRL